jgi:hypothetical protein
VKPTDLADLAYWYDSDTVTLATGVSQWTDLSSNARHLLQATPTKQPAYSAAALNGHATITGDGVDDFLKTATFTAIAQPFVMYGVMNEVTAGAPGAHDLLWDGDTAVSSFGIMDSTPRLLFTMDGGAHFPLYDSTDGTSSRFPIATWKAFAFVHNGANSYAKYNSVTLVTSSHSLVGNCGSGTAVGLTLNALADGTRNTNVGWASLFCCAHAPSDAEIIRVFGYLAKRYNL